MPTRILDLPEYYTSSGSMYLPVVDINATGSNKNKKIRLTELMKSYQVSTNTSSFVSTGFGFGYFGDNSDGIGDFSSSIQVSSSFSSSTDSDAVIKNFSSLFISESLLVSPINRCDGMLIFVDGDCVISGSLSMTAKGASGVGLDASFFPLNPPNLGYYWNDIVFSSSYRSFVSSVGSAGNSNSASVTGSNGRSLQLLGSGSGYSGGGASGGSGAAPTFGGSGSAGTSFSGGSGGGGAGSGSAFFGGNAALNGGAGGNAGSGGGGGAGNPGGSPNGGEGTGGLLILIVKGNLFIGPSGSIRSNGSNGGNAISSGGGGGGGSGGGIVYVYYGKTFTSSSSSPAITVTGGIGGAGSGSGLRGGDGGTGSLIVSNLYTAYPIIY
jgi:hypothetical protein